MQLAEADIDFNFLVGEGDDGYLCIGPCCQVLDIEFAEESFGQSLKKMGLSLYKIRAYTNKIDITAIGSKIEYITTKGEKFSCIRVDLFLIDAHLILSDFDAPLLHDVANEAHRLILQQLLRLLLVEVVLSQDLLHQLRVDVRPLAFYHVEGLTVHQLLLDLVLSQAALALYVVHHLSRWIEDRRNSCRLVHQHQVIISAGQSQNAFKWMAIYALINGGERWGEESFVGLE